MKVRYLILAAVMCGLSGGTWASGFSLSGKTASNTGNAFSGTTTLAEDASVVYTNPAAMQDLKGTHFTAVMSTVTPNLRYKDKGSAQDLTSWGLGVYSTSGPGDNTVTDPHYLPNLYFVNELGNDMRFGFGIYAAFGLGLDYDDDWEGRYVTTGSDMQVINFSPAISIKASEKTNLAFGIDFQYLNATLKNAVDYGAACYAMSQLYPTQVTALGCIGAGMTPQGNDGSQELTGSNWAMGYTLGMTYDIDEASRFGLTFHSSTRHDVSGNADFSGQPTNYPNFAAIFSDTDGDLVVVLPETLSLGYSRTLSPQLQVMADATWTRWSRYDELVVNFANQVPSNRTEQNWNDVWRLSVGANYQLDETWLLRGGLSYDPSPVPDAQHRSARVPDGDRTWISLGARANLDSDMDLDLAVAYNPDNKYKIDSTDSLEHNLKGEYTSSVLYLIAQLNWKF